MAHEGRAAGRVSRTSVIAVQQGALDCLAGVRCRWPQPIKLRMWPDVAARLGLTDGVDVATSGELDATAIVSGTLGAPRAAGEARAADLRVTGGPPAPGS